MDNSETNPKNFRSRVIVILIIFLTYLFTSLLDVTVGNPLKSFLTNIIYPPKLNLTIAPNFLPKNGIVEIEVQNNGDLPLTNFFTYYQFLCFMNESKGITLSKQILNSKESGFLEIAAPELDPNCSIGTKPLVAKFYKDQFGHCYTEFDQGTSQVCLYCKTQVNVSATELDGTKNITKKFEFYYPFFNGTLIFQGSTGNCLPIELAPNKTDLTFVTDFRTMVFDASTYCLKGNDPNWCQTYGFLKYPEVQEVK